MQLTSWVITPTNTVSDFSLSDIDIDSLVDNLYKISDKRALGSLDITSDMVRYKDDPVGFIEDMFGETLTDDLRILAESVRDHEVTVAISCNSSGKSWISARLAVWFYLCHQDTKVFTAAAPPYDNLKNILWGEIGSIVKKYPDFFENHDCNSLDVRRGPEDFLTGVTIPSSGSDEEREAKFCADADDMFELTSGALVPYRSLIDKAVDVVSVDKRFNRVDAVGEFFDNGLEDVYEVTLSSGHRVRRTSKHPLYAGTISQCFKTLGGTHIKGRYRVSGEDWVNVEDLKEGSAVLCPTDTAFNFGNKTINSDELKVMAYLNCKRVPEIINQGTRDSVSLFLNRLYSTDGWACMCKVGKDYKKAEIGYYSNSEGLVRDVQRLLFRFGISATVTKKKTSWTCTICRSEDIIRFADEIGIYGKEDSLAECVAYASSRGAYASWRKSQYDGFRWDKVKSVELLGERQTVGVHVPGNNTYLTNLVEHNSGKHQKNMLFILDEGDAIPDCVYNGIDSCMSGGHVRLLILFNPRRSSGAVYRMIRDEQANIVHLSAFRHPNVISGKDVIPGAVTRDATTRRINEWTRPMRDGDKVSEKAVYTLPDYLEGAIGYSKAGVAYPPLVPGKYVIIDPSFSYMVLGRYPAAGTDQLISSEWIASARSRYDTYVAIHGDTPPVGAEGIMGLDVAEMGDDLNVAVARYGGYLTKFDTWGGVDPIETGDRAYAWYDARPKVTKANVDATGVGAGVAPHMQRLGAVATSIKVASKATIRTEIGEFRILRDEVLWRVREWLRTDMGSMLPPDKDLEEELLALTYNTDSGYVEILKTSEIKKELGRSPDRLMSLAMTFANSEGFFSGCVYSDFPED